MNAALVRLWGWPLLLAGSTCSGLVSALLSDGWGDLWSWLALGLPVVVSGWCVVPRRRRRMPGPSKFKRPGPFTRPIPKNHNDARTKK
jgi:hypothetical protein